MVFSQTSHKTQSILKVVDLDRLKPEKSQQVNGSTGVVTDGNTYMEATPASPVATTSYSEDYLKPEPLDDVKMFHDSDSEFFQDLVHWYSTPAKEEQVQTIDSKKPDEKAHTIDTPHTPLSPQGWETFDNNSPYPQAGFYNTTPVDPLSPNMEAFPQFDNSYLNLPDLEKGNINDHFQEQFLDISSLPVVIGDLMSERVSEAHPWPVTAQVGWANPQDTNNIKLYTNEHNTTPFIDQEDSLDLKYVSVIPREVENNIVLSEYIVRDNLVNKGVLEESGPPKLSVDVASCTSNNWPNDIVSTPEILSYVEQLEKEKCPQVMKMKQLWPVQEVQDLTSEVEEPRTKIDIPSPVEYEPITPKSESHVESDHEDHRSHASKRRRHNESDDSDETYTPYSEQTPRKYKRRKPNIPIKDMIIALEGSQQLTKARRGRPPKRRESTVSSVCSVDENSSCASTTEVKYRELRDKNNEASKRSRMNRKLKELQMEQLAEELEEKNKKLQVKADILEDMTKRLKEALMTAILQK